jgi:hypothetical protein
LGGREDSGMSLLFLVIVVFLAGGCATNNQFEQRPFFQQEYGLETHGRKTLFDRVVELDPGGFKVKVKPEFVSDPPARIAVLPFSDEGSANFVVDKIPLTFRNRQQRNMWSWTDAQRLRRAMQGYLSQREFVVANLYGVDAVMQDRGVNNAAELLKVSPRDLGDWLDVDAVMYGTVVDYDAYYLGLFAAWQVGIHIRLVSTRTGDTLIEGTGSRWDVNVLPALTVEDIAINSAENLLELRDINLARAEDEACREVVKRIPPSPKLVTELAERAREHEISVEARRQQLVKPGQAPETYPVVLDPAPDLEDTIR